MARKRGDPPDTPEGGRGSVIQFPVKPKRRPAKRQAAPKRARRGSPDQGLTQADFEKLCDAAAQLDQTRAEIENLCGQIANLGAPDGAALADERNRAMIEYVEHNWVDPAPLDEPASHGEPSAVRNAMSENLAKLAEFEKPANAPAPAKRPEREAPADKPADESWCGRNDAVLQSASTKRKRAEQPAMRPAPPREIAGYGVELRLPIPRYPVAKRAAPGAGGRGGGGSKLPAVTRAARAPQAALGWVRKHGAIVAAALGLVVALALLLFDYANDLPLSLALWQFVEVVILCAGVVWLWRKERRAPLLLAGILALATVALGLDLTGLMLGGLLAHAEFWVRTAAGIGAIGGFIYLTSLFDPPQEASTVVYAPNGYGRYAIADFIEPEPYGNADLGGRADLHRALNAGGQSFRPKFEE
jgi:hypothetical protein